ncbi:putative zinc finger protein [Actinocrispum wychmicini]|uniref:Putative zinc finger protein n=1 Tax=Actinocrispum wychmicini TaxID=1213861 RepID=A0A4R2JXW4_9PSEU|nr:putative zinc finger protein [Actinocrispum wychmicini]
MGGDLAVGGDGGIVALVAILLVLSAVRPPAAAPAVEPQPSDLACRELVDLVTSYLDGVLAPDWRAGLDHHLQDCDGCTEYVHQIRGVLQALSVLKPAAGTS